MKFEDRTGLIFMGMIFGACGIGLLIPPIRESQPQSGISGLVNLPTWLLLLGTMVLALICAALIVRHHLRKRD